MSTNSSSIADADGGFSDWVELYNSSDEAVNLEDYFLSDKKRDVYLWSFPELIVPANGFVVVWASGKDKVDELGGVHTNFKIDKNGETLLLADSFGDIIDSVTVVELPTDYTYVRIPDGSNTWWVSDNPSPGSSNERPDEYLQSPMFSAIGGFYDEGFELELTHPDSEVMIIYTLDGSIPTIDNLNSQTYTYKNQYRKTLVHSTGKLIESSIQSFIYQLPLDISSIINRANKISQISTTYDFEAPYLPKYQLEKCAVIKAVAYKDGLYSEVITHSYFKKDNQNPKSSLDIISLSADERDLFDYNDGIFVPGVDFDEWRAVDPISQVNARRPANYNRRGRESERTVSFEIFDGNSQKKTLGQDVGVRVQGAVARAYSQKSLKLYARSDYGKSKLDYQFFEQEDAQPYKRLSLRSVYNRRYADSYFTNLIHHLDIDKQYNHPYILFLNGEYYGLYDLKEKLDEHYFQRKYNIKTDNVDIIENYSVLENGNRDSFQALMDFVSSKSLTDSVNYQAISEKIDIGNFMDYQIVEIFSGNTDWPQGNVQMWRYNGEDGDVKEFSPKDGRWRWILYDLDFAFGLMDETLCTTNTLPNAIGNGTNNYHVLFYKLLQNKTFKNQFVNRFSDLLNTTFLSERLKEKLEEQFPIFEPFVAEHYKRWNINQDNFSNAVEKILTFSQCRTKEVFNHINSYFKLNKKVNITLDVDDRMIGHKIKINSILLDSSTVGVPSNTYPWTGTYFDGVAVEVSVIAAPGYEFSHWENMPSTTPKSFTHDFKEDANIIAHFNKVNNQYSLTYTSSNGGYIVGDSIQTVLENESGAEVFAKAYDGYAFIQWSDGSTENPRTDKNVKNDVIVQAQFGFVTGLTDLSLSEVKIYPNPVSSVLYIDNGGKHSLSYNIFNIQGQNLLSGVINKGLQNIDVSILPSALYYFEIMDSEGNSYSRKFYKE